MKPLLVERLLNLVRAVLLITTLLALATAGVWAWAPRWVNERDDLMVSGRVDPITDRFDALLLEDKGSLASIEGLEALVKGLRSTRRGELLADVRRRALKALASSHDVAGNRQAALELLEEVVAFDDKDIDARLNLAQHLLEHEDRREEGLADLAYLFSRVPEDVRVAEAHAEALADDGKMSEALEVAADHDRRSRSLLWRVYWKPNPKATVKKQALMVPRRTEEGVLVLKATLEGPVRYLQFNVPERVAMTFEDPVLRIRYADRETEVRVLDSEDVHLSELYANGKTLSTTGRSNAFFQFELKSSPRTVFTEIVFEAPFAWGASPVLATLAKRPELAQALTAPDSPFDAAVVAELKMVGLKGAFATPFELFWSTGDASFDARRKARGSLETEEGVGELAFKAAIEVKRKAERLRLDLPDTSGLTWELTSLELDYGDEVVSLDPEALVLARSNSLSRDGARFLVEGRDPWFTFEVPLAPGQEEARKLMVFRLEGAVR